MPSTIWADKNLRNKLKGGKVVVMPTDTIYGVVGKAESEATVERIYVIKGRAPEKPCIILVSGINELEKFSIALSIEQKEKLKEYWPGPVSIILDCLDDKFSYLHRGTKTLAFRIPLQKELVELLKETGPLVAPSANPEGEPPAKNTEEARSYFGESVDMYIDGGETGGNPSKIIQLHKDGIVRILRE